MQDPTYKSGKFGEIKELILGMLDTYNYELTLLRTTHNLLGRDLHGQYRQQQKFLTQGFKPNSTQCTLCSRPFNSEGSNGHTSKSQIIIFRCGHIYHRSCLEGCIGFEGELICIHCNKSNAINTVSFRRSTSRTEKNHEKSVKKPGAGKRVDFQVNLTQQQMNSLNRLWEDGSKNSKSVLMAELLKDSSTDWSSGSGRSYGRSISVDKSSAIDEKFDLKLAPPPLRNNFS